MPVQHVTAGAATATGGAAAVEAAAYQPENAVLLKGGCGHRHTRAHTYTRTQCCSRHQGGYEHCLFKSMTAGCGVYDDGNVGGGE